MSAAMSTNTPTSNLVAEVIVLVVGRTEGNYTLCKGSDIKGWFAANRIPALWSPLNRGWWLRSERLPDVVALAQHQGLVVKAGSR
jgi:hypothetical protein